jgi:hypothetical protein
MAYTRVQNSGKLQTATGANLTWTPLTAPTVGNLLTYRTWGFTGAGITYGASDVTDSSGTPKTFTRDAFLNGSASTGASAIYSLVVPSGLTTPVKDTNTGSFRTAIFDEWSGNATTSVLDNSHTNNGAAGTTGTTGAGFNTGANAGLVLDAVAQDGGNSNEAITATGTSFTQDVVQQDGNVSQAGAADERTASAASQTGLVDTWTWVSNVVYHAVIASYNVPSGGAAQDTPELDGRPFGLGGQRQMHQLLAY